MKMNSQVYEQMKGPNIDKYKRIQVKRSVCALCMQRVGAWTIVEVGIAKWNGIMSSFKNIHNIDNEENQGA